MRFQKTEYTCGPASVINSLRALGVKLSEELVAELADTTEEGTDEFGIQRALRQLGFGIEELDTMSSEEAWEWLTLQIRSGRTAILSVENFSHWASVIGILGTKRVIYVDSQDGLESNRKENGIRTLTRRGLTRIWGSRGRGRKRNYYAIAIITKPTSVGKKRQK